PQSFFLVGDYPTDGLGMSNTTVSATACGLLPPIALGRVRRGQWGGAMIATSDANRCPPSRGRGRRRITGAVAPGEAGNRIVLVVKAIVAGQRDAGWWTPDVFGHAWTFRRTAAAGARRHRRRRCRRWVAVTARKAGDRVVVIVKAIVAENRGPWRRARDAKVGARAFLRAAIARTRTRRWCRGTHDEVAVLIHAVVSDEERGCRRRRRGERRWWRASRRWRGRHMVVVTAAH